MPTISPHAPTLPIPAPAPRPAAAADAFRAILAQLPGAGISAQARPPAPQAEDATESVPQDGAAPVAGDEAESALDVAAAPGPSPRDGPMPDGGVESPPAPSPWPAMVSAPVVAPAATRAVVVDADGRPVPTPEGHVATPGAERQGPAAAEAGAASAGYRIGATPPGAAAQAESQGQAVAHRGARPDAAPPPHAVIHAAQGTHPSTIGPEGASAGPAAAAPPGQQPAPAPGVSAPYGPSADHRPTHGPQAPLAARQPSTGMTAAPPAPTALTPDAPAGSAPDRPARREALTGAPGVTAAPPPPAATGAMQGDGRDPAERTLAARHPAPGESAPLTPSAGRAARGDSAWMAAPAWAPPPAGQPAAPRAPGIPPRPRAAAIAAPAAIAGAGTPNPASAQPLPPAAPAPGQADGPPFAPDDPLPALSAPGETRLPAQPLATGTPAPPLPPAAPETLRLIASQIGAQPLEQGRGFDLALSPEELGHVRLRLSLSEAGNTLLIQADRPETLDLMRRHVGQLEHDLRQMGHAGLSLHFAQTDTGGQQGQTGPRQEPGQTPGPGPAASGAAPPGPIARPQGLETLDLRL